MKVANSIKVSSQVAMTPTLTAAIKMLQLSQNELYNEICELTAENPFIEHEMNYTPISSWWDKSEHHHDLLMNIPEPQNLQNHLHWQLVSSQLSKEHYQLGEQLILSLDDKGFLPQEFWANIPYEAESALRAWLHKVEPLGIGASSVVECLEWQLAYDLKLKNHPFKNILLDMLSQETKQSDDILKSRLKKQLAGKNDQKVLSELINYLSFEPAARFNEQLIGTFSITPDLIVYKSNGVFEVRLNEESLPKVNLCNDYKLLREEKSFKELYQQARWFFKAIQTRHDTLLKVAKALVKRQQDFFLMGKTGLQPLILEDISQETGFHGSTISRVTTNKYIQTPNGLYELKLLLSRGMKKRTGEIASTTSIKQVIMEMIKHEDPCEPLSDKSISDTLAKQGYVIARRTIAKYREQLGIASSNERRQKN